MMISVVLITYNQEEYIRQAVESILMQHFDGDVEIIIADDCSTDNTYKIIKSYEDKTSFKFRFLERTTNLGISKNYQKAFKACEGEYIAVLEGDDFWCNSHRLQKHVDFLEEHRECVMSWNPFIRFYESTNKYVYPDLKGNRDIEFISLENLLQDNRIPNFSSCVYRGSVIKKMNLGLFDVKVKNIDDWLIGLEISQYGLVALMNECMTIYRMGIGYSHVNVYEGIEERIPLYDEYFNYKYTNAFRLNLDTLENKQRKERRAEQALNIPPIIIYTVKCIVSIIKLLKSFCLLFISVNFKRKIKFHLKSYFKS
jgi:glycosyltransferase involved in cell wall biosynthesis